MLKFIKNIFANNNLNEDNDEYAALDFSHIDSREKAIQAVGEGGLVAILAVPEILGGEDVDINTFYIPRAVVEVHSQIVETLVRYVDEDLIDNLQVKMEYKGSSIVPSEIKLYSSHSNKTGQFNPTIKVW